MLKLSKFVKSAQIMDSNNMVHVRAQIDTLI